MALRSVVILSAARTPIGSFAGSLSAVQAPSLGSTVIKSAVERAGIKSEDVQECLMGNVVAAGVGQAPARQAAIGAGLLPTTVCTTINKVCASGMKSVTLGAQSIMLGNHDCVVAGGLESMSNIPHYLANSRTGTRLGHGKIIDGLIHDGLWDPYDNQHMGMIAEHCAETQNISREEQDDYGVQSYLRAQAAHEKGYFKDEITPVVIPQRKKDPITVSVDEEHGKFNESKFRALPTAFKKGGTVTAGNASKINDGGAAFILMAEDVAKERGLKPIARIRGFADAELPPIDFPIAPATAVRVALERANLKIDDIDYFEINEAFSCVALANQKLLGISGDKLNVHGGAVALGHPIGSSGARILVTLSSVLRIHEGSLGLASICNGGGGGTAIIIEKM